MAPKSERRSAGCGKSSRSFMNTRSSAASQPASMALSMAAARSALPLPGTRPKKLRTNDRDGGKLLNQPRLADPGLATNQKRLAVPGFQAFLDHADELLLLAAPADERAAPRGGGIDAQPDQPPDRHRRVEALHLDLTNRRALGAARDGVVESLGNQGLSRPSLVLQA
jgi:hypothetical protein